MGMRPFWRALLCSLFIFIILLFTVDKKKLSLAINDLIVITSLFTMNYIRRNNKREVTYMKSSASVF